jgi:ribosomal protein L37AE/L43A
LAGAEFDKLKQHKGAIMSNEKEKITEENMFSDDVEIGVIPESKERFCCPECKQPGVLRNVGQEHWFTCDACRVKWHEGTDLFSAPEDEAREQWEQNKILLSEYREVPVV